MRKQGKTTERLKILIIISDLYLTIDIYLILR